MAIESEVEGIDLVTDTLLKAQCVAIYTHINTDCDAMGSSLALKEALAQLGKKVDIYINSNFPSNFKIYGDLSFVNHKTCDKYDVAVCLDCNNESRLGKYKFTYRKGVKKTILIDHHVASSEKFCNINYVKWASSTAEILIDVLNMLDIKYTESISKNLLTGMITDTGKFVHTTTPKTLYFASQLLSYSKLKIEDISDPLFNTMSQGVFSMLRLAYQNMEFYSDGKLAIVIFPHSVFVENGTTLDELDALPDLPLQLESVKFAILASEDDKGYFRVSLRSKGDVSARTVAESFGGGGHFNASGCKIFGELAEVKQRLIDATLDTLGWKK